MPPSAEEIQGLQLFRFLSGRIKSFMIRIKFHQGSLVCSWEQEFIPDDCLTGFSKDVFADVELHIDVLTLTQWRNERCWEWGLEKQINSDLKLR